MVVQLPGQKVGNVEADDTSNNGNRNNRIKKTKVRLDENINCRITVAIISEARTDAENSSSFRSVQRQSERFFNIVNKLNTVGHNQSIASSYLCYRNPR